MYGLNRLKSANRLAARFTAAAANSFRSSRRSHAATAGIDDFASVAKISDIRDNSERKMLPPELSRFVVKLECDSSAGGVVSDVYLVGAKAYAESWRQVEGVIQLLKPQVVFLDMCSGREHRLTGQKAEFPTIGEMVDMLKRKQNPFWRLVTWHLYRNEPQLEVSDDFRVAYAEAMRYGGKVILGNRPLEITFSRYWAKVSLREMFSYSQGSTLGVTKEIYEKLVKAKDDAEMDKIVDQAINEKYPIFRETFIHECDRYMSAKLLEVARQHNSVVAVVGMAHLRGIQKHWKEPLDMEQLLHTPTRMRRFIYIQRILCFVLILFIAAAAAYIYWLRSLLNCDSSAADISRETYKNKMRSSRAMGNVAELRCESAAHGGLCHVYLVGTAHGTQKSCEEVKALIEFVKPEVVFVELCPTRDDFLKEEGGEFRVANEEAIKCGAKVVLGDRPIDITLARFPIMVYLWELLIAPLQVIRIIKELYHKMDELEDSDLDPNEIGRRIFPSRYEIIVNERNQYMSAKLLEVARQHKSVVAVVGLDHLQGIEKNWEQPIDMKQLLHTPSRTRMVLYIREYMLWKVVIPLLDVIIEVGSKKDWEQLSKRARSKSNLAVETKRI